MKFVFALVDDNTSYFINATHIVYVEMIDGGKTIKLCLSHPLPSKKHTLQLTGKQADRVLSQVQRMFAAESQEASQKKLC